MNLNIAIRHYCHYIYIFLSIVVSLITCCTCVCLQCHEACIAIYSSMENQKLSHWVCISTLSMFFCLLVYTLTGASLYEDQRAVHHGTVSNHQPCRPLSLFAGVYGFMTFGREVAADILMSYPGNDVVMIISRLLFGISIITIYPIILLLGRWALRGSRCVLPLEFLTTGTCCLAVHLWNRSVILNLVLRLERHRRGIVTHSFESRCRFVLTVIWISVTVLTAMFVPDMSKVISVIGGISAFFIFIFPGD